MSLVGILFWLVIVVLQAMSLRLCLGCHQVDVVSLLVNLVWLMVRRHLSLCRMFDFRPGLCATVVGDVGV